MKDTNKLKVLDVNEINELINKSELEDVSKTIYKDNLDIFKLIGPEFKDKLVNIKNILKYKMDNQKELTEEQIKYIKDTIQELKGSNIPDYLKDALDNNINYFKEMMGNDNYFVNVTPNNSIFSKISTGDKYTDNFLKYMDYKNINNTSSVETKWLENRETMFENTNILFSNENINESINTVNEGDFSENISDGSIKFFDLLIKKSLIKIKDGQLIIDLNDANLVVDSIFSIFKEMPNESLIIAGNIVPAFGVYFLHRKCVKLFSDYLLKQETNYTKNYNMNNPYFFEEFKNLRKSNRFALFTFHIVSMGVLGAGVAILARTINQSLTWKIKLFNEKMESPNILGNDSVNIKSGVDAPPSMAIVPFLSKILNTRIIKYTLYSILLVNIYIFYPKLVGYINYNFCLYFIFIFTLIIFYNIFNIILYIYIMDFKGSIKDHKILNKLPNFLLEKYLVFNNSKSKDFLIPHFFKLLIFYILMLLIIISLILVYFLLL